MEYDPAHKTSSITSTSTASTWDHPISNDYYHPPQHPLKSEEFDASLVSERIAIPPFEYFEDHHHGNFDFNNLLFNTTASATTAEELPELVLSSSSSTIKNDAISASHNNTNITNVEPIYLQQAHQMTLTTFPMPPPPPAEKQKQPKDIVADDEKRTNHIISEQKRRNTIRLGFKELTDIIPTLKNINNSKSTILFKAVEFMKHLDKRNRALKDKVKSLQIKVQLQGRVQKPERKLQFYQQNNMMLPPDTVSALIAHKNQQKQLELLQNQLRIQHQLLQKHNIISPFDNSPLFQQKTYHSISIPSSRSSESDENEHRSV